jgi:hypothetical protein
MERITIGKWEIEYDKKSTENAYSELKIVSEECGCSICRNYFEASKYFPIEIKNFFTILGIDIEKPIEVYDCSIMRNGKIIYYGWYYIIGRIIGENNIENEIYKIQEDFNVLFSFKETVFTDKFSEKAIVMSIEFLVPWMFEDKSEIIHFEEENNIKSFNSNKNCLQKLLNKILKIFEKNI